MGYNTSKQTVSQFQLKGRYARQYLSFAGKSSKDFLLYLSGPGVYDSPAADVESTSVPGRNGDIITENARTGRRRYQNVDIKYKAFFFNGLPAKTAAVKAWLLSPIGYQKLQDTYDPDFFRMAVCKDALAFDVTAQKAAEIELTFNCKGNTTRYAFNAATLKQSTVAWKNSAAGLFVSTDGGKTWGYGWEADDTAVRTAILLEQTLKELDDRYKKATELSEELLKELDERYKTATAISAELQKTLDQRYETAKKLSKDLYEELDKRYGTLTEISEDLQKELDERYSAAKKLSEEVEKELDEKYQPSVPVSETAPEAPAADTLWVDKKNLRLKLWDGEQWQTIGHEPEQPTEPTTPTEPEKPEPENPDTEEKDNGGKEETDDKKTDQEGGSA